MVKTEDGTTLSRICYSEQSLSWALLLGGCALRFIPSPPTCPIPLCWQLCCLAHVYHSL